MSFQIIINIALQFSIISLVGISFFLIFNTGKYYAIHHSAIIALGGYFTFFFHRKFGVSLPISIFSSIIITGLLGLFIEFFIFKNLRKKSSETFFMIIASLGIYVIMQNLISIFWGDDSKTIRVGEVEVGNIFLGAYITDIQIVIIIVSIILIVLSLFFLKYTNLGKKMQAVSSNEELSNIFGINSNHVILWSFGVGSALAAIAGILIILDTDMTPSTGFKYLFYGVVAMIIGGVGNFKGLIAGALILVTAQNLSAYYIDSKWMDATAYVILILFLVWKPLGFSGKRLRKVEI
ncbi:MAG: branched-chain amino acid ABC transporter permease [Candidatus Marinimicrobia bacterium]|nr:branched-chain amino acid ABC transporter permease [Candidatus Neomarinimicrobiota bacterium]